MFHIFGNGGRRWLSRRTLIILTNLVSLACLVWVLHDLNVASLVQDIKEMHWGWVFLAAVADIVVHVWQGYR